MTGYYHIFILPALEIFERQKKTPKHTHTHTHTHTQMRDVRTGADVSTEEHRFQKSR